MVKRLGICKDYIPYVSDTPVLDSEGVLHNIGNIKKKVEETLLLEREDKEKKRLSTLQENRVKKAKVKAKQSEVKEVKKEPTHNIPTELKEKYKLSLKENNISVKGRVTITRFARLYGRGDYNQGIIAWITYLSKVREKLFQAKELSTVIRLREIHGYYTLKRARENAPEKILPRNIRSWQRITRQLLEKPKKAIVF